ncbi:MAG: urea ABC transporter substrate-binding protein [Candidatus Dependentiae bacterium]|nr:urea ABC transporter substrate-binding protein [Candidatus Dependentiae bacterium]
MIIGTMAKFYKFLIGTALITFFSYISYVTLVMVISSSSIKVGVLHSQTGVLAISELSVIDATLLAIDQINKSGGLLGKIIEPVLLDGASDPATFQTQAERLILDKKVDVIFGCWTSASRKAVRPMVEKYDNLLFYPVQYEGIENSPNIIYTGSTPNQQIMPALTWALEYLGNKIFLVGSDYVYPRTANRIINNYISFFDAQVVGEHYISLEADYDVYEKVVKEIVKAKPSVIINTINGSGNSAFFRALKNAGVTADTIPTMSFSIAEEELSVIGVSDLVGNYATWAYFQSVDSNENKKFVELFKQKYGDNRVISDPLEAAWFGVQLWAKTVKRMGTSNPSVIKLAVKGAGGDMPEGIVTIDSDNNNTWKMVRIGKIKPDGQFEIVWHSQKSIRAVPFPSLYQKENWDLFLEKLYLKWNKKWSSE